MDEIASWFGVSNFVGKRYWQVCSRRLCYWALFKLQLFPASLCVRSRFISLYGTWLPYILIHMYSRDVQFECTLRQDVQLRVVFPCKFSCRPWPIYQQQFIIVVDSPCCSMLELPVNYCLGLFSSLLGPAYFVTIIRPPDDISCATWRAFFKTLSLNVPIWCDTSK